MPAETYVKLFRRMTDWGWYKKPLTAHLFSHLLLTANYKEGHFEGHQIKPGQIVVGRKALSTQTGLSEQQVRTALTHLASTSDITIKPTSKFSIITITKWVDYQQYTYDSQPTSNQQVTSEQPHLKKVRKKEGKNKEHDTHISEVITHLNKIANKSFRPESKSSSKFINARLEEGYTVSQLKNVIDVKSKDSFFDNKYMRPETLFNETKFQSYVNENLEKSPLEKMEEFLDEHRNN